MLFLEMKRKTELKLIPRGNFMLFFYMHLYLINKETLKQKTFISYIISSFVSLCLSGFQIISIILYHNASLFKLA